MDDLAFAGIARQAELIRGGEVSSRELVELYLGRIERLDPQLNAFRVVFAERALADADEADRRRQSGEQLSLLGVPIAIKDDVDVAGEVTAHGSRAYGPPAAEHSEVVKRLRAAGAIPIGKTNVPELEQWPFTETEAFGITRNPWNPDHVPGGSSGGSAAAVAAGLVGAAQGSDGAGSIRIPAACCRLFGVKPARGRLSWAPKREGWNGMAVLGPLARTVVDAALFLDATAGGVAGDAATAPPPEQPFVQSARRPPGKLRIAVSYKIPPGFMVRLKREVRDAVAEMAELLRSLGHDVRERDPAYGMGVVHVVRRYTRGIRDDAAAMARPELLERRTRGMARLGGLVSDRALMRLRERAEPALAARLNRVFDEFDVLLTPVFTCPPVKIGRWDGQGAIRTLNGVGSFVPFPGPWNATGNPAASVPAGFSSGGLPIGVQFVGRLNDEATLLSLAAQIEAERPWAGERPPVS